MAELQAAAAEAAGGVLLCSLPISDARCVHLFETLNLADGDQLKVAVVDGSRGVATVRWLYAREGGVADEWETTVRCLPLQCHLEEEGGGCVGLLPYTLEGRNHLVCKRSGARYGRRRPNFDFGRDLYQGSESKWAAVPDRALLKLGVNSDRAAGHAAAPPAEAPAEKQTRSGGARKMDPRSAGASCQGAEAAGVREGAGQELAQLRLAGIVTGVRLEVCLEGDDTAATEAGVDIDVLLACPRPKAADRLLAALATFGVRNVVILGAKACEKVEGVYLNSTRLKDARQIDECLLEGLSQAAWRTRKPRVRVLAWATLGQGADKLAEMAGAEEEGAAPPVKLVAHPYGSRKLSACLREAAQGGPAMPKTVTVALGPEGGWTNAEMSVLEQKGFRNVSLGPRILKTYDAAVTLLSGVYAELE